MAASMKILFLASPIASSCRSRLIWSCCRDPWKSDRDHHSCRSMIVRARVHALNLAFY